MWRDPLDELIEDLDQVVGPAPVVKTTLMPLEELLKITDRISRDWMRERVQQARARGAVQAGPEPRPGPEAASTSSPGESASRPALETSTKDVEVRTIQR